MDGDQTSVERAAYDRGRVDAVLDDHTQQLARITESIENFARELARLTKTIADHQTQRAQAEGEALAVRLALEDAVRKHDAEKKAKWSRREKLATAAAAAGVPAVGLLAWIAPHPF